MFGEVWKMIEQQKEMEERKGNTKVDSEDNDFQRVQGEKEF